MKTRILHLLALTLMGTANLWAQQALSGGHTLKGVWQQVQTSSKSQRVMRLPVWKVLQGDGSFCTFLIGNEAGLSIITNQGRYEPLSDSTYVEYITGSITDPNLVGKSNTLRFRMSGPDTMHVRYRVPGASRDGKETWVRVKLQKP